MGVRSCQEASSSTQQQQQYHGSHPPTPASLALPCNQDCNFQQQSSCLKWKLGARVVEGPGRGGEGEGAKRVDCSTKGGVHTEPSRVLSR